MNGPLRFRLPLACAIAAILAAACGSSESAPRSRGEDLLKATSTTIAGAQAFSFAVDETTERVTPSGEKRLTHVARLVTVRRPDRLWFRSTGDRNVEGFYDGARVTLLFHGEKAFGIVPTPATLDDTIDVLSERYDIPLTIGDLITTNPHRSMVSSQTTGGWQDEEDVSGVRSARLDWHHPNVDWSIWIPVSGDPLPTKLFVNYKTRRRLVTALFKDWDLNPAVTEDTFQSRVPDDYEGIAVIQRAAVVPDEPGTAQGSSPQE
jgi:hypothetical protein